MTNEFYLFSQSRFSRDVHSERPYKWRCPPHFCFSGPPGRPHWEALSAPRSPHGRLTAESLPAPPTGHVAAPGFQHFLPPEHWAPRPSYFYGLMRPWNDLDLCLPRFLDLLHNLPQRMGLSPGSVEWGGEQSGAPAHIYLTGGRLPPENGQSGF